MSDELTLQDLLETQAFFRLPSPALVEKDYYVVKALRAIASTETAPLRLIFGGGTALARAHRLVRRMSEDIDLKIIGDEPIPRPQLRVLREGLTVRLREAGFEFDSNDKKYRDSRNETRYTIFRLPYPTLTEGEAVLRPEIQIEIAVWPLRRPSVDLAISSFVAEAFKRESEVARVPCVSVTQTAAEKFVALTRRSAIELANAGGAHDPADIRHIYDLHLTRGYYDAAEVAALAHETMRHDANEFGHQFPAYRDNPLAETRRAIEALSKQERYPQRYAEFCQLMVYGERPPYAEALGTVRAIAERLG